MKSILLISLVFLISCTKKDIQFLGLKTGEVLNYKVLKKTQNDSPMLARELRPFYEIEYNNLSFSNVGVAQTELLEKDANSGFAFKSEPKIWGFVFFNRDGDKKACTEDDFKKIIQELGIDESLDIVNDGKRGELDKGFFKWNTYYKNGVGYTIICHETTKAVKVLDYNVLLKNSNNEKTNKFFSDSIREMDEVVKRKL